MKKNVKDLSPELLAALPNEVPIPAPEQFCKGSLVNTSTANKQCCLLGWCSAIISGDPQMVESDCHQDELARELAEFIAEHNSPTSWNDDLGRKPTTIAKRFENKMRALGYEIT